MGNKDIIIPPKAPKGLIKEINELNKRHLEGLKKIEAKFTIDGNRLDILKYCSTTIPNQDPKQEVKCYMVEVTCVYNNKVITLHCTPPSCVV